MKDQGGDHLVRCLKAEKVNVDFFHKVLELALSAELIHLDGLYYASSTDRMI